MSDETLEDLSRKLNESEVKTIKLKDLLIALKTKSTEVQELCKRQKEQHEKDVVTIKAYQEEVLKLQKRCEELEATQKQWEANILSHGQGIDKGNAGAGLNLLQSFKQELRSKRQAEGGNEDAVMQSAVSVCEGALGILKAALAGTLVSNQGQSTVQSQSLHAKPQIADPPEPTPHVRTSRLLQEHTQTSDSKGMEEVPEGRKRPAEEIECLGQSSGEPAPKRISQHLDGNLERKPGDGVAAVDHVQEMFALLMKECATQEIVDMAAATIFEEVREKKSCPMQCFGTCAVLAIISTASNLGTLQPPGDDICEGDVSSGGSSECFTLLDDSCIEDVAFSNYWMDPEQRESHSLTSILACIARLDQHAAAVKSSGGSSFVASEFSVAVEGELQRILLIEHRQRAVALACEDCALTTALMLLLRMRGRLQAGRILLLDILTCAPSKVEISLPCIASALAAFPALICASEDPSSVSQLFLDGLRGLCLRVVGKDTAEDRDDSTVLGSMSGTTMPAACREGPRTAAEYLLAAGKTLWKWQDTAGCTDYEQQDFQARLGAVLGVPAEMDWSQPSVLGSAICSCCISTSFLGIHWTCQQVVSYGFMPQLSRQKDQDKSDRLAAIEEIIHKLLDFSQIRAMKEEFSDEQWREMWQRVKAAKACPVSIKTRLHAIAL